MAGKSPIKDIFFEAVELKTAENRDRYLNDACGGNADLRRRVEALLAAHAEPESYLDRPAAEFQLEATDDLSSTRQPPGSDMVERPGTMIGPYKLMEQVGEGGMGVVYVAEQREPVRRKVALKIIKPGMDTKEVIARFEAERQALALMDHPNIAKVLDAGAAESGRLYFVMELVRGITVTQYCDQNNLTTRERLELFVTVCNAIKHAHQKGVIHRDVKPSNVMVTLHDGKPVPKIIDFGVAKAINQQLTERTIYTQYAQMVGTPLYMSPEQAEMSGLDIDTRTDIYSLGVLLYELLTGTTPFEKSRIHKAAYDEIRRIIREEEPPKPSARISTLGKTGTSISAHRKSDPKRLSQLVRGDLDWIVMKTLEKDRTRRYETANDLAADILRHLNHEPITASPPSTIYKLRKFVRRNKATMATVGLVATALVLGSIAATWQAVRATQAEKRALVAGTEETAARRTAEIALGEADKQARQAQIAADRTTEARRDTYRYLYVAHMNLAHQAWETQSNVPRTVALLNRHLPKEGGEDLRGFEWYYLRQLCREALATPTLLDKTSINSVSFSPDGRWLATGGHDNLVKLWGLETRSVSQVFEGHAGRVRSVAFSPDGKTLASGSVDRTIKLWDLAAGKEITTLADHKSVVWAVTFSPDGTLLASSGGDGTVKVWDVDTGQLQQTLTEHKAAVDTVAFSPDGKILASGSNDRTIKLWDPFTGDLLQTFEGHSGWIRSIAFSSDGLTLASGSMDTTIRLWTVATGEQHSTFVGHSLEVTSLAFSPDGSTLASGSGDNTARLWDLKTSRARTFRGHGSVIWSVAFSPDGNTLASGSYDQTVKLWDLSLKEERNTIAAWTTVGRSLEFSSDGKSLTIAARGKLVTVYEVATCAERRSFDHRATNVVLTRDNTLLATNNQFTGVVKLWEFQTGKERASLTGLAPTFSQDGDTLVLGSMDGKIRLWDIHKGEERTVIEAHAGFCGAALLSDGRTLISGELFSGTIKFWDAPTGVLKATEETGRLLWGRGAESWDGTMIAMAVGQLVRIWDVATGEELPPFEGHAGDVTSVVFSSDGNRLVTGSQDGTVKLWDIETREPVLTLKASPGLVHCVAFSRDGKTLAAASESDRLVRLWRAPTDEARAVK